jgi:hypothetical protein
MSRCVRSSGTLSLAGIPSSWLFYHANFIFLFCIRKNMNLLGQMIAAGIYRLEVRRDGVLISRQTATARRSVWNQAEGLVLVRVIGDP